MADNFEKETQAALEKAFKGANGKGNEDEKRKAISDLLNLQAEVLAVDADGLPLGADAVRKKKKEIADDLGITYDPGKNMFNSGDIGEGQLNRFLKDTVMKDTVKAISDFRADDLAGGITADASELPALLKGKGVTIPTLDKEIVAEKKAKDDYAQKAGEVLKLFTRDGDDTEILADRAKEVQAIVADTLVQSGMKPAEAAKEAKKTIDAARVAPDAEVLVGSVQDYLSTQFADMDKGARPAVIAVLDNAATVETARVATEEKAAAAYAANVKSVVAGFAAEGKPTELDPKRVDELKAVMVDATLKSQAAKPDQDAVPYDQLVDDARKRVNDLGALDPKKAQDYLMQQREEARDRFATADVERVVADADKAEKARAAAEVRAQAEFKSEVKEVVGEFADRSKPGKGEIDPAERGRLKKLMIDSYMASSGFKPEEYAALMDPDNKKGRELVANEGFRGTDASYKPVEREKQAALALFNAEESVSRRTSSPLFKVEDAQAYILSQTNDGKNKPAREAVTVVVDGAREDIAMRETAFREKTAELADKYFTDPKKPAELSQNVTDMPVAARAFLLQDGMKPEDLKKMSDADALQLAQRNDSFATGPADVIKTKQEFVDAMVDQWKGGTAKDRAALEGIVDDETKTQAALAADAKAKADAALALEKAAKDGYEANAMKLAERFADPKDKGNIDPSRITELKSVMVEARLASSKSDPSAPVDQERVQDEVDKAVDKMEKKGKLSVKDAQAFLAQERESAAPEDKPLVVAAVNKGLAAEDARQAVIVATEKAATQAFEIKADDLVKRFADKKDPTMVDPKRADDLKEVLVKARLASGTRENDSANETVEGAAREEIRLRDIKTVADAQAYLKEQRTEAPKGMQADVEKVVLVAGKAEDARDARLVAEAAAKEAERIRLDAQQKRDANQAAFDKDATALVAKAKMTLPEKVKLLQDVEAAKAPLAASPSYDGALIPATNPGDIAKRTTIDDKEVVQALSALRSRELDKGADTTASADLLKRVEDIGAKRLAEEKAEAARPKTVKEEMAKHTSEGIRIGNEYAMTNYGDPTSGIGTHAQVTRLQNIDQQYVYRELDVAASQANSMVIVKLDDIASKRGQTVTIRSGECGPCSPNNPLARDATLVLTLSREDMEKDPTANIKSINIKDGVTTVTLKDDRTVQSRNDVVFRSKSGPDDNPTFSQMSAQEMQTFIVQREAAQQKKVAGVIPERQNLDQTDIKTVAANFGGKAQPAGRPSAIPT